MRATGRGKTSGLAQRARRSKTSTSVLEVVVPVKIAAKNLKLGRSSIYRLVREGTLDTVKLNNCTWILLSSIMELQKARGVTPC
jgi:hypothetical protein